MSNTKFMVVKLKELIYTFILLMLGIVLIVTLVIMFKDKKEDSKETSQYTAGIYTTKLSLNGNPISIKISLDKNHINSIETENLSDSVAAMYPLVKPAVKDISDQIIKTQSLDNINFDNNSKYTYTIIYDAIANTINRCSKS